MREEDSAYRKFVLSAVDKWLEGISIIGEILVITSSWSLIKEENTCELGITLLLLGTLVVFLLSWIFFCIIDTRNLLIQIEENTRGGITVDTVTQDSVPVQQAPTSMPPQLACDEKYCPNCNAIIKKTAKKCRFCNTWIENIGGNE